MFRYGITKILGDCRFTAYANTGTLTFVRSLETTPVPGIFRVNFPEVTEELKQPKTFLLDVRETAELISDGKIEGSKNIPLGEVEGALKLDDKMFRKIYGFDKPNPDEVNLVIHCKAGVRAMKAAVIFNQVGYSNIKVYDGILDWQSNGGTLTK